MGELTNLTSLNLSFNNFEGEIPEKLFRTEKLETLLIHANNLSGIIPQEFCDVNNAIKILIYGNSFCPPYPHCIKFAYLLVGQSADYLRPIPGAHQYVGRAGSGQGRRCEWSMAC